MVLSSLLICCFIVSAVVAQEELVINKFLQNGELSPPPYWEYAKAARWMISTGKWGVLATDGSVSNKAIGPNIPFSKIVSFADGIVNENGMMTNCTGKPYFFMMDGPDGLIGDLKNNNHASFSLSKAGIDGCKTRDVQDPTCWKASIIGTVDQVDQPAEIEHAKNALFSKHPQMASWPSGHSFKVFKLSPIKIFLIDIYGGPPNIPIEKYLQADIC